MKKFITFILCLIIGFDILDHNIFNDEMYNYLYQSYNKENYNIVVNTNALKPNQYVYREFNSFLQNTTNYYPNNRQQLLNIYYTVLNNGLDDFSYYCKNSYATCLKDVNDLSYESSTFTYVNQFIHPYNSYASIKSTNYSNNKRIDVAVEKKYSKEDQEKIENRLDEIFNMLNINSYSSINSKIKVFHDYIANINVYDQAKVDGGSTYHSDSAIGTLFEGYSICSGYSDTMAIFLNRLGLENVKVVTDKHVWNAVKIDDKWYHIDLTWDDPVVSTGENIIQYDYFLLTTDKLLSKNDGEHNFNTEVYDFLR